MDHQTYQPHTWRELLQTLSKKERRQIIATLGIAYKTWMRWISGYTDLPHASHLRALLNALPPQMRGLFLELAQRDPSFAHVAAEVAPLSLAAKIDIPSIFYASVLDLVIFPITWPTF